MGDVRELKSKEAELNQKLIDKIQQAVKDGNCALTIVFHPAKNTMELISNYNVPASVSVTLGVLLRTQHVILNMSDGGYNCED